MDFWPAAGGNLFLGNIEKNTVCNAPSPKKYTLAPPRDEYAYEKIIQTPSKLDAKRAGKCFW